MPDEGPCRQNGTISNGNMVYYLNGLGGNKDITPRDITETTDEYSYTLFLLEQLFGKSNVLHLPVFTDGYRRGPSQREMYAEIYGRKKTWTNKALGGILSNPPHPDDNVILVGSSAGGSVAIELLDLLEKEGIFVDHLVARGSPINEPWLNNLGQLD